MTFPRKKKLGLMLAAAGLLLGAFVGLAFWSARRAFERARASLADENELRFVTRRLTPVLPAGVEPLGTSAGFKDAAFFHDRLYLGGPAKLLAYSTDGKIVARYCVGLELPSAPMVALAAGMAADATEPELYVATAGAGLLALGEQGLRQVIPEKETLRRLTAVLALPNGRLLLGTERNGVLVYDGKHLALFHPALAAVRVTALAGDESSFWVGTIDQGVLHWHAGEVDRFGEA
ncbi:MAG: hypothetical protein DMG21_00915, partial [Acidobacteria bacterium]